MSDRPQNANTGEDTGAEPPEISTGTPRWVKVFWIVIIAVVLLAVILLLIGGHGPSRHA